MDSVTQKNNLLSMTGIDQTDENSMAILELETKMEENTIAITGLQTKTEESIIAIAGLQTKTDQIESKTTVNTDDITTLENLINPFVQNVAPYIVLKNNVTQTIDGVKTFLNPIFTNGFKPMKYSVMGQDFYEPITFNPDGKYKMTFDVHKGLDVNAPIRLLDNALSINNISGLQDALNSAANTEVKDRSITTQKIALNTILGDNFNKAISFSTTGDISATIGTFTQCVSVICQAGSFGFLNKAPLLNVSIPCFPKIITGTREFNLHFHSINDVSYLPYIYPFDFTIHSIAIRTPQKTDSFDYSFYSLNFLFTLITTIPSFADEYTYVNFGEIMVGTSTVFVLPNPLQIKAGVKFFLKATNVIGYVEWLNFEIHGFQY